ncbi:hypothetical protein ACQKOF_13610 [Lysinibacillus sp. NPDC093190]|uniref:hypothetical protein n=1 Tax=Lysinibacillus sp. NPDC093190 TaxID=3390575 RepID=UPI003D007A6E
MLKEQTAVTKKNLLQWIENYRWMVETIEEARQLRKLITAVTLGIKQLSMVLKRHYQKHLEVQVIQYLQRCKVVYIH